ncbi:MAG: hypothetical protein U9N87_06180, partial [Planctomycetota bacterium]|nr:hypothetical protein [Planctomycetota bacterium]
MFGLNHIALLLLLAAFSAVQVARSDEPRKHLFDWQKSPWLPVAVEGAFVGVVDDALILAGGRYVGEKGNVADQTYSEKIFVMDADSQQCRLAGKLDEPLAFGAAVATDAGLLCMGGRGEEGLSARVFLLRRDAQSDKVKIINSVDLPRPAAMISAAKLGNTVYVAGAKAGDADFLKAEKVFLSLDVSRLDGQKQPQWQTLPPYPCTARFTPIVVVQSGGLYLIGGSRFPLIEKTSHPLKLHSDAYR